MKLRRIPPRTFAKFAVKAVVHGVVAQKTEDVITDYTSLEEDTFTVDFASNAVGWYVSSKLQPYTDYAVDKTADKIVEKREARAEKKKENSTEK